jgi:hypothetical protein
MSLHLSSYVTSHAWWRPSLHLCWASSLIVYSTILLYFNFYFKVFISYWVDIFTFLPFVTKLFKYSHVITQQWPWEMSCFCKFSSLAETCYSRSTVFPSLLDESFLFSSNIYTFNPCSYYMKLTHKVFFLHSFTAVASTNYIFLSKDNREGFSCHNIFLLVTKK